MAMRLVPPSACPISFADLVRSWHGAKGEETTREQFCSVVAGRVGMRYAFAFNHARTAIALLLQELHQVYPERNEVVIPAYTCYTVAAAITRARLVVVPVDIAPSCFCYKPEALVRSVSENTLAIIVVHPFGYPCDVQVVREVIGKRNTFILEDCAQAWDSSYGGNQVGRGGDASVFSFGRGKHINLGGGGICCLNDTEIAYRLRQRVENLPTPSRRSQMKRLLQMMLIKIGQYPYIYSCAARLPFLGIGETRYDPDFSMMQWTNWQAQLGLRMLARWQGMAELRRRNSGFWRAWLEAHSDLGVTLGTNNSMDITYLRMPVLSPRRAHAMEWFRRHGIHAQRMYPATVADISDHRLRIRVYFPIEGARQIAEMLYTLPVHPLFDAQRWAVHHGGMGSAGREETAVADAIS